MIYRLQPPEMDRVYHKLDTRFEKLFKLSTVGFEPQTYCMVIRQSIHYTRSPDLKVSGSIGSIIDKRILVSFNTVI